MKKLYLQLLAVTGFWTFVTGQQVTPVNYSDLFTLTQFNQGINVQLNVGAISGQGGVSAIGAAEYTIPLDLPAGTNNLMPQLSVNYNSNGPNGLLGVGWGVSGLSEITVVPKTIYHEGKVTPLSDFNEYALAIDGNRMMATSGTFGADGTIYATESETFTRITGYGTIGTYPAKFIVKTKEGLTLEYGTTLGSVVLLNGNVASWKITRITDQYSNYIEFNYRFADSELTVIDNIQYTGNTNQSVAPYNKIQFRYGEREDQNFLNCGGSEIMIKYLMTGIEIQSEGELAKRYEFKYALDNYSLLQEVKSYGSNGGEINATKILYNKKAPAFQQDLLSFAINNDSDVLTTADYNNDGKSDLLTAGYIMVGNEKQYISWSVYLSDGNGNFAYEIGGDIPYGTYIHKETDNYFIQRSLNGIDFFGDGCSDLVLYALTTNGDMETTVSSMKLVNIYMLGGSIFKNEIPITTQAIIDKIVNPANFMRIGDFDGNSKTDLMLFTKVSAPNAQYNAILLTKSPITTQMYTAGIVNEPLLREVPVSGQSWQVMDINGDGKHEISFILNGQSYVYEFQHEAGQIISNFASTTHYVYSAPIGSQAFLGFSKMGDFNGDGKTDFLTMNQFQQVFVKYGGDYWLTQRTLNVESQSQVFTSNFKVADYNGDGKSDILYFEVKATMPYKTKFKLFLSTGDDFIESNYEGNYIFYPSMSGTGDFNGDGKEEELFKSGPVKRMVSFYKNSKDLLVSKIKNGIGEEVQFDYTFLPQQPGFVKTLTTFPAVSFQGAIPVVSAMRTTNGVGGFNENTYSYSGSILHKQGKGFLGFKTITTTNLALGQKSVIEAEFNLVKYIPVLKSEKTYLLATNELLKEKTFANEIVDRQNNRFWLALNGFTQVNHFTTVTTSEAYKYDEYGNIVRVDKFDNSGTSAVINTYATFNDWWIPSRLITKRELSRIYPSNVNHERFSMYQYSERGSPISFTQDYLNPKAVTLVSDYDGFGNLIKSVTTATDLEPVQMLYKYDAIGRFVVQSVNDLNQVTSMEYNRRVGKPTKIIDIDGLVSQYKYNEFGAKIEFRDPRNQLTNFLYAWDQQQGGTNLKKPIQTIYKITETCVGQPQNTTWFDVLSRPVKSLVVGQSDEITTVTRFNQLGNLKSKTSPFVENSTTEPLIMQYTYDAYNRLDNTTDGFDVTQYTYENSNAQMTTNVSNAKGILKQTKDAAGRLIKSVDQGGILTYTYYDSGLRKEVLLNGVVINQMEYDIQGNQTMLKDQNSGTNIYAYDAYKRLKYQKDANGDETFMEYDASGHLSKRISQDLTQMFDYVASGPGMNKLKSVTNYGVYMVTKSFEYNSFSDVIKQIDDIDGEQFTHLYTYNNFGENTSIVYPSGYKIDLIYDNNGYLDMVKNVQQNKVLFRNPKTNAFGQYTKYKLGNGKSTTNEFSPQGMPVETTTNGIQHLVYNFDPETLHLSNKSDLINNVKDEYYYDNLNRLRLALTKAGVNNTITNTIDIDFSYTGNIINKTGVGDYTYDQEKKNAVVSVENTADPISWNEQKITYDDYDRVINITENGFDLNLIYGIDLNRVKTVLRQNGNVVETRYYLGNVEKQVKNGVTREIHYLPTGTSAYVIENGVGKYYYFYRDHLNTITAVTNDQGNVIAEQRFDAWGRQTNPDNGSYVFTPHNLDWLGGYTGHEHLDEFDLINMNNRLYDPKLARMLSVDNYVQDENTQAYNRYSYAWNNPMSYTDPSGDLLGAIAIAAIVGGTLGAYSGGVLANQGQFNPLKWDYSSGKTWGYMLAGAATGALSGALGGGITQAGGFMANTFGIMAASSTSTMATALYTGLQTDVTINLGAVSYNATQSEWGYIGKPGNSKIENWGYTFGAMANLQDLVAGFNGTTIDVRARKEAAGHSEINGKFVNDSHRAKEILISVGPEDGTYIDEGGEGIKWEMQFIDKTAGGENVSYISPKEYDPDQVINKVYNINGKFMSGMTSNLNSCNNLLGYGSFRYGILRGCVNYTSRALLFAGVPTVNAFLPITAPLLLNLELTIRQIGIFASPFLINNQF